MPKGNEDPVWEYFEKNNDAEGRVATCKVCFENYSYSTTIANLKQHLRCKHSDVAPDFVALSSYKKPYNERKTRLKTNYYDIWGYFTPIAGKYKIARCHLCCKKLSYRTKLGNLAGHLRCTHPDAHNRYIQGLPPSPSDIKIHKRSSSEDSKSDHDAEDTEKQNDIWNFFEQEDGRTHCAICRDVIEDTSYDGLKAHMFTEHPTLLLQHVQEQEQDSQETYLTVKSASDDDENLFTEVVYLEQHSPTDVTTAKKRKIVNNHTPKYDKKRIKNDSSIEKSFIKMKLNRDEAEKEYSEEVDELDAFLKYEKCLLKKLSPDIVTKVQIDILKIITDVISAQKIQDLELNQSNGTGILTDIGNNVGSEQNDVNTIHNYSVKIINTDTPEDDTNIKEN